MKTLISETPAPAEIPAEVQPTAAAGVREKIKPYLNIIMRALHLAPRLEGLDLIAHVVLEISGQKHHVCPPELRRRLADLQKQWDRGSEVLASHEPAHAVEAMTRYGRETLQRAIQTGEVGDKDGWSRKEWEAEYHQKCLAAFEEQKRICGEASDVVQPVGEAYCRIAKRLADAREDDERDFADSFGVNFRGPSDAVLAIRKTIPYVRARTTKQEFGATSPKQMLPFLDL